MSETYLTNSNGYPIGRVEDNEDEIILYSLNGPKLGRYDKRSDETSDGNGYFFGRGNLLAMLLPR